MIGQGPSLCNSMKYLQQDKPGYGMKKNNARTQNLSSLISARFLNLLILVFLVPIFLMPIPAMAQLEEAVQAFDEGNAAYLEGDYQGAINAYNKAIDHGYVSGSLFYNLGNAYYRHDELGQAIRYYEKARLLMPNNRELAHNLAFTNSKTIDTFSQLPLPAWTRWWRSMIAKTAGTGLYTMGILAYLLAVGLLIFKMWTKHPSPWIRRARSFTFILAGILLVSAFAASMQSEEHARAVVIAAQTALREAPAEDAPTELSIHEGLLVDVLTQEGTWAEVKLPNGARGWILAESLADV